MSDFIAAQDRALLEQHGLASFDALWALQLEAVDEPNTERGGWSSVYRLDLGEAAFYLKRQSNHLTRSLLHPFGEPTFAREFRNIQRYAALGIPALQAAFFAERRLPGERRALLLTRALDGWQDLDAWLPDWAALDEARRTAILKACGELARRLHQAGQMHGCFYPKHIFLRETVAGFGAQLIDLEKTRPLLFGQRDRVKDLEPLLRRASVWSEAEVGVLLAAYLGDATELGTWSKRLGARRRNKEARR
ncbi:MAG: lipopolysaccharide kinase InaA family protein [Pseudomonas sp.]|uniref:lipopolysaccharide kinase InaA family protein n=1 Tax=Pseudomonas sp. TaxID=306 RepID=UPI002719EA27|nr:lipopolysaccharide kinase InaA family protein [Pseudomonas sp.]MDO9616629.1 lipopolysaccharide kinase InaA family protein [Pseudomonas sp.]MDP2447606.1 lipopolysaccharide kinase InaA family protein [Pseudomonas sp.]MDZ4335434.1 lipopolysaccharide kinase InaA family protein [Pseudomonas sp.]